MKLYFNKLAAGASICLFLILTSCSNKNSNDTSPSISANASKVYFSTDDFTSKMSYLYSFDLNKNLFILENSVLSQNLGMKGFQTKDDKGNVENLYTTENIDGQPSRVTVYSLSGSINQNTRELPENIYDMLIVDKSLYSIGFNKKEIAVSDPLLNFISLPKTTLQGFSADPRNNSDQNNFVALLNQGSNFFVFSSGYTYKETTAPGAKIYQLNSDLTSYYIQSWTVQAKGSVCYNLYSTIKISNNKLIAYCNPPWEEFSVNVNNANPSLFLIDVSSSTPVMTLLKTGVRGYELTPGGLSNDKNYVLVTENLYTSDTKKYLNPTVSNSYWLHMTGSANEVPSAGAFAVTYNNATNSYVFSCVLNSSNQCINNALGVAQPANGNSVPQGPITSVSSSGFTNFNGVRGISFFRDL